jgi:esterase/lipase superfamily enzyme
MIDLETNALIDRRSLDLAESDKSLLNDLFQPEDGRVHRGLAAEGFRARIFGNSDSADTAQTIEFFSDRPTVRDQLNHILSFLPGAADNEEPELNMGQVKVSKSTADIIPPGSPPTTWEMQDNFASREEFLNSIEQKWKENPQHKICVFIPGFSTSFDHAASTAAALQRDTGIPVVLDSWPSNELKTVTGYIADEDSDEASLKNVGGPMIDAIADRIGAHNLILVGFSQGSKVAIHYAIDRQRRLEGYSDPLYAQVFQRADEQLQEFKGQFKTIIANADHTAIFTSPEDRALRASGKLHWNRRTGNATPEDFSLTPELKSKFKVVDSSYMNNGLVNHVFDTKGLAKLLRSY